jgi:tripartite-type tricarboxylate transporter receptor subunit TctC
VALVNAASSTGVIKAGQVRALAIMSDRRVAEYADVPTLAELGYANAKGLWSALYAPAATPRDVLETVRAAAAQALHAEAVESAFGKQMIRALPSASLEDAQDFDRAEIAYWKKVTDEVKVELPD